MTYNVLSGTLSLYTTTTTTTCVLTSCSTTLHVTTHVSFGKIKYTISLIITQYNEVLFVE